MKSYKNDAWKASFKNDLKCCMFGFLYGMIAAIAFIFFFSKFFALSLPICLTALIGMVIWNIRSIKFSLKALFIEFPIAVGSFFIVLLLWALTGSTPIVFID